MSYGELHRRAGLLAARLVASGVRPGDLVPVLVPRREAVTAILGVLMAGAAYVPLDPRHPESRLTGLVARIGATVVVTDDELAVRARAWSEASLVPVEPPADQPPAAPGAEVKAEVTADDLAYVMFTSGSTGTPKGVQITHRNVTRLMAVTAGLYGLAEHGGEDVWTMTHSYAFDFSVWEMWGALLFGGRLVVVDDARAPDDLLELIDREGVTVLSQTPSALATLISADEDGSAGLERLRLIVLGGERLDPAVLRGWFARRGDECPRVVNMYGITETTVHVTHRPITAADAEETSEAGSPIGVPLPDLEVSLRDENGEPTPVGEVGEIWVSGAGLARGYLADDQATARAFRTVTWAPGVERRAYLSGDLARAGADGQLYYVGRRDDQVKVRGHRVELGEVGAAIRAHPGVVDACVATDTGESVGARLLAWVTVRSADLGADGLRAYLTERLPGHMVPGEVHVVEDMPLTPNGKIDRRALLDRARATDLRDDGEPEPGDPLQTAVAGIWAQELGVATVGPGDDFFDLGGHSLLVMRVITRTRKELGANIRVRALFEAPRLADFVERVRAGTEDQARAALDS